MVVMLVSLVLLALFLAPRRPSAPPVSSISYTARPEERKSGGVGDRLRNEAPVPLRQKLKADAKVKKEPAPQENTERPYGLLAVVVDTHEEKPIANARVLVRREWTPEEQEDWNRRNAEVIREKNMEALDALKEEAARLNESYDLRTGDKGEAEFKMAMAGSFKVSVYASGYTPVEQVETVRETQPKQTVKIKLSKGAMVFGRVTEAGTNAPAVGIIIEVEQSTPGLTQERDPNRPFRSSYWLGDPPVTDDEGNFCVSGLPVGEFGLSLNLRKTPYKVGKVIPYQKVSITRPDQELKGVDFTVDPAGIVWGYVTTPKKEPVKGADILLCTSQSVLSQALTSLVKQAPPLHDSSEEDGYYELMGVPLNEEYRLYATSEGHSPQLADPFILTAANRSVRIDVFMFGGTNVYGRVVDSKRKPVQGAQVLCIPSYKQLISPMQSAQAFRDARSDNEGNFTIKELPPGNYQVFAQKERYKIATSGEPIYPNGYSDITGLEIMLYPVDEGTHSIYGTVVDTASQPIDGVRIVVEGMGMESLQGINRDTTTGSDGKFRIDGVETGAYRLTATMQGYAPRRVGRALLDRENKVVMDASAVIRGVVLVKETNTPPVGGYSVGATPVSASGGLSLARFSDEQPMGTNFNNPDGSYELYVAPGIYRVEARATGFTPSRLEVSVEAGQVLDNVNLLLSEKGGTISGRVTTNDGASPQGTQVTLIEAGTESEAMVMTAVGDTPGSQSMQVGSDGAFSFTPLPAGSYTVVARHPSYPAVSSRLLFLEEQGTINNVELRLGAGGGVHGYVYRNGKLAAGAMVVVMGGGATKSATTDQNGYYTIDGLSTGTYQAMVSYVSSAAGADLNALYDIQGVPLEIQEGRMLDYNFGDTSGVTIEGHCSRSPGLAGYAVLRAPGMTNLQVGDLADIGQLTGQFSAINMMGDFELKNVPPGQWQLDIYFPESGVLEVRYVHTELVEVTGDEQNIPLDVNIRF